MYSVSLLPYEYKLLNTKARKKNVNLLIAIGVMGVLFVVYMVLTIVLTSTNAKLNDIRKEAYAVESQISKLDDLLAISNEVNKMLNDASLAAGSNPEWGNLIVSIGNSVPESISLKNIEMKYSTSEGQCSIKGFGLTHQSVSEWLKKLEEVDGIGEIKCEISNIETQQSGTVNFELDFTIHKGPGYKLPVEVAGNE